MSLIDTFKSDIASIERDFGYPTFTWKSEDYICVPSGTGKGLTLEEGGFAVEADFAVTVRKELFTDGNYPKAQETIVRDGITYRILTIRNDPTGAFMRLICQSANRGV